MSVRVLDGEQPGYAVLVFDKQIDSPSLRLAIKSFQVGQGAYLGPSGAWDRSPHFFTAARVETPKGGFGYRVGPEVVNYLLEDDHIEASSDDGLLREDGYWANATPLMMPGGARPHTFVASTADAPSAPSAPVPPSVAPPQPSSSPASPPAPPPNPRESWQLPDWLPSAAAAAVLLTVAIVALVPSLRCSVFGSGCAAPSESDEAERGAAKRARDCAVEKEAAADSCSAEAACFSPYRGQFPHGASLAQIEEVAARVAQSCQTLGENQIFASAKQCAAGATTCVVETCYAEYLRTYANGGHAGEARADIARAKQACLNAQQRRKSEADETREHQERAVGPAPLLDGEYAADAIAVSACGVQRQRPHVFVCSSKIWWVHEAPLAPGQPSRPLKWEGSISDDGSLQASVGGSSSYVATARIADADRKVEMRYPGCASPVTLSIRHQLSAGCSEAR